MNIGKIPNDLLKKTVINNITVNRKEVLIKADVGEDCTAISNAEGAYVLSTDPITAVTHNAGKLAVNVVCNDLASSGVVPVGIMLTVLLPPQSTLEELQKIMEDANAACKKLNVEIIGGHTEVTDAVNRIVISATATGNIKGESIVRTSGAQVGDYVIMTKTAGIEGTAIIAQEKSEEIEKKYGTSLLEEAQKYIEDISVVKEGIIAQEYGVTSMHDITEGGVYGAIWETAEASGKGVTLYDDKIPVTDVTTKLCSNYKIDYKKLISSGSMLITAKEPESLIKLLGEQGIKASVIGEITDKEKIIITNSGEKLELNQPDADEVYKIYL